MEEAVHKTFEFPDVLYVLSYLWKLAAFQISRESATHVLPETVSKYDDLIQHSFLIRKTTSIELSAWKFLSDIQITDSAFKCLLALCYLI